MAPADANTPGTPTSPTTDFELAGAPPIIDYTPPPTELSDRVTVRLTPEAQTALRAIQQAEPWLNTSAAINAAIIKTFHHTPAAVAIYRERRNHPAATEGGGDE